MRQQHISNIKIAWPAWSQKPRSGRRL